MSTHALTEAIMGLLPSTLTVTSETVEVPDGQVTADALPWVVVRVSPPDPLQRSLAGTRHGRTVRVSVTIAAATFHALNIVYGKVDNALDGATPQAAGWVTSPLRQYGSSPLMEDPDITVTENNRRVVYCVVDYEMTVSERR